MSTIGVFVEAFQCPLYPRKRTSVEPVAMSALCQKQTAPRGSEGMGLSDHLVCFSKHRWRNRYSEFFGDRKFDNKLERLHLLDGNLGGLLTIENHVDKISGALEHRLQLRSVRHETLACEIFPERVYRHSFEQRIEEFRIAGYERISANINSVHRPATGRKYFDASGDILLFPDFSEYADGEFFLARQLPDLSDLHPNVRAGSIAKDT